MPFDSTAYTEPLTDTESTANLLRKAKVLLENGWCRQTSARDVNGHDVDPLDPTATQYCAYGALYYATSLTDVDPDDLTTVVEAYTPCRNLVLLNDHAPKSVLLAAFDRAIAAEEA